MEKLYQLRQQHAAACDELEELYENPKAFERKAAEIADLAEKIKRIDRSRTIARTSLEQEHNVGVGALAGQKWHSPRPSADGKWKNFGENLQAIARGCANGGIVDERLVRAPFGAGETDPSAGGFLVDVDFANTILTRAYDMGEIAQRLFRLPISAGANGIKIPGVDEQSRATGSRWGGVQSYWVAEGDSVTATKPKFRLIELDLKKLMSVWYVTDEMMADAVALTGIANQAFAEEIMFMIEDSTIHGSGAGMPEGLLRAPATVTVAPEKGQTPATFLWENVVNMWANMWARSRRNAVWFINQEIEPQLYQLRQVVGTGGMPIYLPQGGASGVPYASLLGRPVIAVEYCEAPGTPGDVILADYSQYVMADKNAMQQMSSIHVRFLTDEMTFRLTYRCDGEPIWHTPLTPFRGTQLRTPFVILGQR